MVWGEMFHINSMGELPTYINFNQSSLPQPHLLSLHTSSSKMTKVAAEVTESTFSSMLSAILLTTHNPRYRKRRLWRERWCNATLQAKSCNRKPWKHCNMRIALHEFIANLRFRFLFVNKSVHQKYPSVTTPPFSTVLAPELLLWVEWENSNASRDVEQLKYS